MSSPKTIYLIDGSAYLYRAFHAIRNLSNSKGLPTNATYGFTTMLMKLIKERSPEYLAMFFDMKGPTFRHAMYDQYKANRPPMPAEMAQQIPWIKQVVAAFSIPIIEKQGFEADDLIGTLSRRAVEAGFHVVMVTGDKDFMQLVGDGCEMWDPMKEKRTDPATVKSALGITPEQVIDMLGLTGDTADNIPGVPGIGPKTAVKLIAEYGSIQGIYDNLDALKSKKAMHKKLVENREEALLSRKLVVIDRFVDLDPTLQDLETFKMGRPDKAALADLFKTLEFRRLQQEFFEAEPTPEKHYRCLNHLDEIEGVLDALRADLNIPLPHANVPIANTDGGPEDTDTTSHRDLSNSLFNRPVFAIDTETTSPHPMRADLVGISFSWEAHTAYYIPVGHVAPAGITLESDAPLSQPDKAAVLALFRPLLEDPSILKVGQNIKYDYIVLTKQGIRMQGMYFDTMIASYLLNPSQRGHSLDQLALNLLGHQTIKFDEVTGKGKNQILFSEVAIDNRHPLRLRGCRHYLAALQDIEKTH